MIPKRVLVIDDEDHIREVAQVALELVGGWEALMAGSGLEGIAIAVSQQPDAILLDVMMPDMDGTVTYQKLKANNLTKNIPVIFLTAKMQAADQRRFTELGVTGIIAKPFDPMTLASQVEDALGWSKK